MLSSSAKYTNHFTQKSATLLTDMYEHDINTIQQVNTVPVGKLAGFFLLQPCFHLSGLHNQNLVYPWCKIANSAAME